MLPKFITVVVLVFYIAAYDALHACKADVLPIESEPEGYFIA